MKKILLIVCCIIFSLAFVCFTACDIKTNGKGGNGSSGGGSGETITIPVKQ